jgi:hypothetical protein
VANPFDQFDTPAHTSGPVTVGTPRPPKQPDAPSGFRFKPDGSLEPIPGGPADKPDKPTSDNLSVNQANTAGFYSRALNANKLYGEGVPPRGPVTQTLVDMLPDNLVRANESDARKNAETAAAEFVAATLRKESGAAISPQEFDSQYARYFPQPGDGPDQIKLKAQLRQQALEAMKIGAGPEAATAQQGVETVGAPTTQEFGGQSDPRVESMNDAQKAAYQAWFKANPNPTPEQLNAFLPTIGVKTFDNAGAVIDAYKKSGQLGTDVTVQPYIGDVRGQGGTSDTFNAGVRGLADTVTLGTADKLIAGADTLFKGGSMDQNLARQYAISDFDAQNHPIARGIGQVGGAALLPMGEVGSVANLALKGAGYGAAYGAGSSRSLSDVPMNALLGGAAGGAVGGLVGGAPKAIAALRGAASKTAGNIDAASEAAAMREKQIAAAQAGADLGVQMPRFVAGGPTAQRLGALADQSQIGAPIIRRATNAMLDQSEAARNTIAAQTGGAAMNHEGMGGAAIEGAKKARMALKGGYRRVYDMAEKLSGDVRVPLPTAKQEALAQIAELSDTPGGVQPAIATTLQDIASKLDGDWTPAGVRRMRTQLTQRFMDSGVDQGDASRRARIITDAAETDMINGLRAANKGDAAAAWQKASSLRASYQKTADEILNPILGTNKEKTGPEVARALVSSIKNNPGRFRQFMALQPPEEANNIRASIIGQMGNPGSGAQDVEGQAFSLAKFLTHWNDLKDVRNHVFDPSTVKSLNKLAMIAERAKQAGHVENHSQTGSIGIALLTAGPAASAPGFALTGHFGAAGASIATSAVLGVAQMAGAKLLASPKFAQWLSGLANAAASGNENAIRSQAGRLAKLATTNPEIRDGVQRLIRSLANDNVATSAAADGSLSNNQQDAQQQ